jgi:hypothetical protein
VTVGLCGTIGTACGDEPLPRCNEADLRPQIQAVLGGDVQAGFPKADGIYEVVRSEPTGLDIARAGDTLQLTFPELENALLPPPGSEVDLLFNVQDDVYLILRDPSTGKLLFEAGNASTGFPSGDRHMEFHDLGNEVECRSFEGMRVASAAVTFTTDEGAVVLEPGDQTTASIEGDLVVLRAFGASRFEHDPGVADGGSSFTNGLIHRLAP